MDSLYSSAIVNPATINPNWQLTWSHPQQPQQLNWSRPQHPQQLTWSHSQ